MRLAIPVKIFDIFGSPESHLFIRTLRRHQRKKTAQGGLFNFGLSKAKLFNVKKPGVTFNGVAGLEINYYVVATDPDVPGSELEQRLFDIVESVAQAVSIPVAVKLSPYYTSTPHVVRELEKRGAKAVVLFNRFLQPDIDVDSESLVNDMVLSTPREMKVPLRWVALLYGRTQMDLALNTGVHSGRDVVKAILAGASAVQVASSLLENGLPYISTMLLELQSWMELKDYRSLDEFRGKVSQQNVPDPFGFERAQYMKLLMAQQ